MRGQKTPPEIKEEIKALSAKNDNVLKASRELDIPKSTAYDIVNSDDEFGKLRNDNFIKYVINTWNNIQEISNALTKKIKNEDISKLNLKEIVGALKDLRQTVENVVNNIHIGDNIQNNVLDPKLIEEEAIEYLKGLGYKVEK